MATDQEANQLSSLCHFLATPEQLSTSSSQLDAVPVDLESSIRLAGTQLTQAAGILLRLPQGIIAHAIVIFLRFFIGPQGGSIRTYAVQVWSRPCASRSSESLSKAKGQQDVSAASLFTTAKISAYPQTPRALLNVYHHLLALPPPRFQPSPSSASEKPERGIYPLSEDGYISARTTLLETESILLRTLGFNTNVILPHRLALTYLQTLGVLPRVPSPQSKALTCRTLAHLNTALFSPQLLYLTHQPYTLAVAAIYLAARETEVKLTEWDWWEIFDVDREDLGFLVVGLQSCEAWISAEKEKWADTDCPLTVAKLEEEIKRRQS